MRGAEMGTTPTNSTTKKGAKGPTDAKMAAKRVVTYYVSTIVPGKGGDSAVRNVAYAVAVDGEVLPEYKEAVKKFTTNGEDPIRVTVDPGKKVSLYLNSDAVPGRRNNPVYEVTVKDKNVEVKVQQKMGQQPDADTPVLSKTDKSTEYYKAPLTGNIWMKVTHKFTSADVDKLLEPETPAEVIAAVKSIYAPLPAPTLKMAVAKTGGSVTLQFNGNQNAKNNISGFSLTADGLPRAHPAGYAAILTAAIDANASVIEMSSNWRPCLGSIAHRCGLGVDVRSVDGFGMANSVADNSRVLNLKKTYLESKKDADKKAWEKARDADQPLKIQAFRRSLQQNEGVKQVIDPWEVDLDTQNEQPATANLGQDKTASSHLDHLHVTACDDFLIK
jgi:hypothetical protein